MYPRSTRCATWRLTVDGSLKTASASALDRIGPASAKGTRREKLAYSIRPASACDSDLARATARVSRVNARPSAAFWKPCSPDELCSPEGMCAAELSIVPHEMLGCVN